jgi:hypothetical protein
MKYIPDMAVKNVKPVLDTSLSATLVAQGNYLFFKLSVMKLEKKQLSAPQL